MDLDPSESSSSEFFRTLAAEEANTLACISAVKTRRKIIMSRLTEAELQLEEIEAMRDDTSIAEWLSNVQSGCVRITGLLKELVDLSQVGTALLRHQLPLDSDCSSELETN